MTTEAITEATAILEGDDNELKPKALADLIAWRDEPRLSARLRLRCSDRIKEHRSRLAWAKAMPKLPPEERVLWSMDWRWDVLAERKRLEREERLRR